MLAFKNTIKDFSSIFLVDIQQKIAVQGDTSSKPIEAVRLTEKNTIYGILSENVWKRQSFDESYQHELDESRKATQRTEVWLAYDNDAIYYMLQSITIQTSLSWCEEILYGLIRPMEQLKNRK